MLKAQLGSKIHALNPKWRNMEDILTGDFFGALDYLPRVPYLCEFISHIGSLNTPVRAPAVTDVDWNGVTLLAANFHRRGIRRAGCGKSTSPVL